MSTNPQDGSRPTVVLVHGAFAESASWNDVIGRLQEEGYTTIAAANPLRSVADDAESVASIFEAVEGPHRPGRSLLRRHRHQQCGPRPRERQGTRLRLWLRPGGGRERLRALRAFSWLHPRRSAVARPALRRNHRPLHPPGVVPPAVRSRRPSRAERPHGRESAAWAGRRAYRGLGGAGVEVDPVVVRVRGARQEHPRGAPPLHG